MRYLSLDIETGGLDPENNDLLEVGVIIADTAKPYDDSLPKLRIGVLPHHYIGHYRLHPVAATMNAKLLTELAGGLADKSVTFDHLVTPNQVHQILDVWFQNHELGKKVVVGGKNVAGFDIPFLRKHCGKFPMFRHRVLDPGMLFLRPDDEVPPDLKTCAVRAGLDVGRYAGHTSIGDASLVVDVIYHGLKGS